jgi:hypothetical protein
MRSPHKYDATGKCYKQGNATEDRFDIIAKHRGLSVINSTHHENTRQHIDRWVTLKSGHKISFSVKGRKRLSRSDKEFRDDLFLIELQGKKTAGWLFGSDALYIAHEVKDGFYIFSREAVIKYVNEVVLPKCSVAKQSSKNNKPWVPYVRAPGGDYFIFVELSDMLQHVNFKKWNE